MNQQQGFWRDATIEDVKSERFSVARFKNESNHRWKVSKLVGGVWNKSYVVAFFASRNVYKICQVYNEAKATQRKINEQ